MLAVSGRVKVAEVVAQAGRLFGAMPVGPVPVASPPAPPAPAPWRETRVVPGAQAQILMGSLAPALTDPDYPAVKVISTVLGGGIAGRFFSELRDKQGLAYTTGTQFPGRVDRSFFLAQLGTAPENVARAEPALREHSSACSASGSATRSCGSRRPTCWATSRWIGGRTRARPGIWPRTRKRGWARVPGPVRGRGPRGHRGRRPAGGAALPGGHPHHHRPAHPALTTVSAAGSARS